MRNVNGVAIQPGDLLIKRDEYEKDDWLDSVYRFEGISKSETDGHTYALFRNVRYGNFYTEPYDEFMRLFYHESSAYLLLTNDLKIKLGIL